jgi:UDP-glucose 4-epimerase
MKVLVTGGAGFIGSHIVDQLIADGHQVVVIDNLSSGRREQVNKSASFHEIDLTSEQLTQVIIQERPQVIVHQAAQTRVDVSIDQPARDANTNIIGTINLLEGARQAGTKKIVFASTAAVYGNPSYLPIDEQHPVQPLSGYGAAKSAAEHYLQIYHYLYGIDYTILRYANVYGLRQDPRGEGGVVSIFIDKILHNQPVTIFGDGEQTRDYVYVEDIARANLLAIERANGEVINVGTGVQTSIKQLIALFEKITKGSVRKEYGPARSGDIQHSYFAGHKAKEHLSWEPQISLEEGLRRTFLYYRDLYQSERRNTLALQ